MTPTYLPSLEPSTVVREKVRRNTRKTAIAQYAHARESLETEREATALRLIAWYWNRWQASPTVGELAARMLWEKAIHVYSGESWQFMGARLWLARGVSGLQKRGLVEAVPEGDNKCPFTKVTVTTWRCTLAGRQRVRSAS